MTWPAAIGVWTNVPLPAEDSIRRPRPELQRAMWAKPRAKRAFTGSLDDVQAGGALGSQSITSRRPPRRT
jgi:hypothetical protein